MIVRSEASAGGDGGPGVPGPCRPARVEPLGAFVDAPDTGDMPPATSNGQDGQDCLLCGEPAPDLPVNGGGAGYHRECFLYTVVGHAAGVCGCTGYPRPGQTVREAARLACRLWREQQDGQPG